MGRWILDRIVVLGGVVVAGLSHAAKARPCRGASGATRPCGPEGPVGATGPRGPAGDDGVDGADGGTCPDGSAPRRTLVVTGVGYSALSSFNPISVRSAFITVCT